MTANAQQVPVIFKRQKEYKYHIFVKSLFNKGYLGFFFLFFNTNEISTLNTLTN